MLDLGRLDYISSAGLRVVLIAAKRLKSVGGALVLCTLNPSVREVFEISGFASILEDPSGPGCGARRLGVFR